jgi:hypothetical protein
MKTKKNIYTSIIGLIFCCVFLSAYKANAQNISASPVGCLWTSSIASSCLDEIESLGDGSFFISDDGKLMYGDPDNECSATELSCAQLCDIYTMNWEGIISASSNVLTNEWDIDDALKTSYGLSSTNPVETGEAGKWYLHKTYVYNTSITQMDENNNQSFDAGVMDDFSMFNWVNTDDISANWLKTNTITAYAPDGNLLEEKNLLDIYATEKYGYNNTLPYLVAQNAHSESVFFESFEYQYSSGRCDGSVENVICFDALRVVDTECSLSSNEAHSGINSLRLNLGGSASEISLYSYNSLPYWTVTQQMLDKGISIKIWVKSSNNNFPDMRLRGMDYNGITESTDEYGNPTFTASGDDAFDELSFVEIAQTGEWKLYEAIVENSLWLQDDEISSLALYIEIDATNSQTPTIYLDDIRMQPLDAQMNCFVYDPATYKVLTSFDDQNFGLYYQYNDEGKLLRKMKETVRGMKTIVETQYNIPTVER